MEHDTEQPSLKIEGSIPPARRLASGANKLERISQHSKSLVDDLTAWVEMRLKLTQIEVEEKIDAKINQAVVGAVLGLLGFLALVFGLTALALGLGAWLGHAAWGFLIVTVLLAVAAGGVYAARPHLVDAGRRRASIDEERLS